VADGHELLIIIEDPRTAWIFCASDVPVDGDPRDGPFTNGAHCEARRPALVKRSNPLLQPFRRTRTSLRTTQRRPARALAPYPRAR
jgi:hypothetical protein